MKKSLLQLQSAFLILILLGQAVYADLPPPGPTPEEIEEMKPIALGIVIGLGVLVVVMVLVAVLVIKAIKKKHSATESGPVGQ
jgi:heme/copper-type cytochrome/quinol oxidase subunit 2